MTLSIIIALVDAFHKMYHTQDIAELLRQANALLFNVFAFIYHRIHSHPLANYPIHGQLLLQQNVQIAPSLLETAKKWLQLYIADIDPSVTVNVFDLATRTSVNVNAIVLFRKGYEYLMLIPNPQAPQDTVDSSEVSDGGSDEATGSVPSDSAPSGRPDETSGSISSESDLFAWFGQYVELDENDPNI